MSEAPGVSESSITPQCGVRYDDPLLANDSMSASLDGNSSIVSDTETASDVGAAFDRADANRSSNSSNSPDLSSATQRLSSETLDASLCDETEEEEEEEEEEPWADDVDDEEHTDAEMHEQMPHGTRTLGASAMSGFDSNSRGACGTDGLMSGDREMFERADAIASLKDHYGPLPMTDEARRIDIAAAEAAANKPQPGMTLDFEFVHTDAATMLARNQYEAHVEAALSSTPLSGSAGIIPRESSTRLEDLSFGEWSCQPIILAGQLTAVIEDVEAITREDVSDDHAIESIAVMQRLLASLDDFALVQRGKLAENGTVGELVWLDDSHRHLLFVARMKLVNALENCFEPEPDCDLGLSNVHRALHERVEAATVLTNQDMARWFDETVTCVDALIERQASRRRGVRGDIVGHTLQSCSLEEFWQSLMLLMYKWGELPFSAHLIRAFDEFRRRAAFFLSYREVRSGNVRLAERHARDTHRREAFESKRKIAFAHIFRELPAHETPVSGFNIDAVLGELDAPHDAESVAFDEIDRPSTNMPSVPDEDHRFEDYSSSGDDSDLAMNLVDLFESGKEQVLGLNMRYIHAEKIGLEDSKPESPSERRMLLDNQDFVEYGEFFSHVNGDFLDECERIFHAMQMLLRKCLGLRVGRDVPPPLRKLCVVCSPSDADSLFGRGGLDGLTAGVHECVNTIVVDTVASEYRSMIEDVFQRALYSLLVAPSEMDSFIDFHPHEVATYQSCIACLRNTDYTAADKRFCSEEPVEVWRKGLHAEPTHVAHTLLASIATDYYTQNNCDGAMLEAYMIAAENLAEPHLYASEHARQFRPAAHMFVKGINTGSTVAREMVRDVAFAREKARMYQHPVMITRGNGFWLYCAGHLHECKTFAHMLRCWVAAMFEDVNVLGQTGEGKSLGALARVMLPDQWHVDRISQIERTVERVMVAADPFTSPEFAELQRNTASIGQLTQF